MLPGSFKNKEQLACYNPRNQPSIKDYVVHSKYPRWPTVAIPKQYQAQEKPTPQQNIAQYKPYNGAGEGTNKPSLHFII
jgi:hypothetical protein